MIFETTAPTLIAEGTRIQGELTFFSGAGVFGIVEGDVLQQSLESLQIGKSGWIHGNLVSQGPVLVEGRVDGDIRSSTKIQLSSTATVRGRLLAPAVEIRAGAVFDGDVVMKAVPVKRLKKAA
jgi:cytoskeletal protein CcmA (bactofilin family)